MDSPGPGPRPAAGLQGLLWIGTATGLSRFDGRAFTSFGVQDGLPSDDVTALLQTRDGSVWVGTTGGLARLRPQTVGAKPFERILDGALRRPHSITALLQDRQDRLWVSTTSELLRLIATGVGGFGVEPVSLGPANDGHIVEDVIEGRAGEYWVGTFGGLFRVLPGGRVVHQPLFGPAGQDSVHGLRWDGTRLWVVFGQGLYVWCPPAADAVGAGYEHPLPHPGGVGVRSLAPEDPLALPAASTSAVFVDFSGRPGGLGGTFTTRDGRLWLATALGLDIWDGRSHRLLSPAEGLPEVSVVTWLEDREGDLWIGTESRGLARLSLTVMTGFGVSTA